MPTCHDILIDFINEKPSTKQDRFELLNSKSVKPEILQYLSNRFQNLKIEVGRYEGNILDLMKTGALEGWCWETTETAIVFLNDEDYIERGYLTFEEYRVYYHSWICFEYENEMYVYDPCLNKLCKKKWYDEIFEIEVYGRATAKEVRDDLISRIQQHSDKVDNPITIEEFLHTRYRNPFGSSKGETRIIGGEDVNSPMYRNNTGYKALIETGKVKAMIARYYSNC